MTQGRLVFSMLLSVLLCVAATRGDDHSLVLPKGMQDVRLGMALTEFVRTHPFAKPLLESRVDTNRPNQTLVEFQAASTNPAWRTIATNLANGRSMDQYVFRKGTLKEASWSLMGNAPQVLNVQSNLLADIVRKNGSRYKVWFMRRDDGTPISAAPVVRWEQNSCWLGLILQNPVEVPKDHPVAVTVFFQGGEADRRSVLPTTVVEADKARLIWSQLGITNSVRR